MRVCRRIFQGLSPLILICFWHMSTATSGVMLGACGAALKALLENQTICRRRSICSHCRWRPIKVLPCCCRNRKVDAFHNIIDWLQPGYSVMEHVPDDLSKENGMAKYAMTRLLQQAIPDAARHDPRRRAWRCAGPLAVTDSPIGPLMRIS